MQREEEGLMPDFSFIFTRTKQREVISSITFRNHYIPYTRKFLTFIELIFIRNLSEERCYE